MVIRRAEGKSIYRFQMVYKFLTARYRDTSENLKAFKCRSGRTIQQTVYGVYLVLYEKNSFI